ncbi:MAG: hypothetical protein ACK5YM_14610, partial [Pseudomonadota bacterium]
MLDRHAARDGQRERSLELGGDAGLAEPEREREPPAQHALGQPRVLERLAAPMRRRLRRERARLRHERPRLRLERARHQGAHPEREVLAQRRRGQAVAERAQPLAAAGCGELQRQ